MKVNSFFPILWHDGISSAGLTFFMWVTLSTGKANFIKSERPLTIDVPLIYMGICIDYSSQFFASLGQPTWQVDYYRNGNEVSVATTRRTILRLPHMAGTILGWGEAVICGVAASYLYQTGQGTVKSKNLILKSVLWIWHCETSFFFWTVTK